MSGGPFDFMQDHEYDHGFCMWIKDPITCLAGYCVPCCAVGYTTGKIEGKGFNIWSCLCAPIGAYRNRRNVQAKYGIKESEDGSMCAVGCCLCCAIAQDMHELGAHDAAATTAAAQPAAVVEPVKEAAKDAKQAAQKK